MGRDRERQADIHAAAVAFDGGVEEFFDVGEVDDLVELAIDFACASCRGSAPLR